MSRGLRWLCAIWISAAAAALGGCSGCEEPVRESAVEERAPEPGPTGLQPIPGPGAPTRRDGSAEPARARPRSLRSDALAEAEERLASGDALERIETLEELEPEGAGLALITRALRDDPDPEVRMAAATQLETSGSPQAVRALVGALEDRDSQVVISAIEALEYLGDESTLSELERYRNHSDPEVRDAVELAIEFLE